MDDSEEQDFNSNTTVVADESHFWIVSMMKTTPGVYSREFYYMQKPINSTLNAGSSVQRPPPACPHQIAEQYGPNPKHRMLQGMQNIINKTMQGNNRNIKDSNLAIKAFKPWSIQKNKMANPIPSSSSR